MYPIADAFPATVVIITEVLFVISAVSTVRSTFLPSASFCSIPISSINAPLVPEPSSRDSTEIFPNSVLLLFIALPEFSFALPCAHPTSEAAAIITVIASANHFFITYSSHKLLFLITSKVYCRIVKNEDYSCRMKVKEGKIFNTFVIAFPFPKSLTIDT